MKILVIMVCFYGRIGLLLMKMCTLGVQSSKWKTFWRDNPWFALRESDLYKWEMTGVYRVWFIYIYFVPLSFFLTHERIIFSKATYPFWLRGRRGRDGIVVGFTMDAICAYHHWCCEFESRSGEVYNIMW